MRFIKIDQIEEGSILGNAVYDTQGRMIISAGSALSAGYLLKLKEYGYAGLYIDDEVSKDIAIEPIIDPSLRAKGMDSIKKMDVDMAMKVSRLIIEEIVEKGVVRLDMEDIRSYDDYTYAHSVNVAVLSCIVGISMKLSEKELEQLVLAALLHDIGKLAIPSEIINKPGRLTKEEYDIIKTHPIESYKAIKDRYDISAHVKNAVQLHHENMDGSGYPKGLIGDEIPLLARIIHVADIFDALTTNRPYKKAYASMEAVEYLMGASGIQVDSRVVEEFVKVVPIYPKGSEVVLASGEKAIVLKNDGIHNMRPVVKLVMSGIVVDLSDRANLTLSITQEIEIDKEEQKKSEEQRIAMVEKRDRVLVVDDMRTNLAMIKEILHENYEVVCVDSGAKALLEVTRNKYDLIIMDIDMPVMNGIEAAGRINEITESTTPILFVTSVCNRETIIACRDLKAAGFIAKPYNNVYVAEEVKQIILRSRR